MIVWLSGTFGVGKTTTSRNLITLSPRCRQFDPESIGYMLADNLADHAVTDFQHYPSWRRLVPVVADEIIRFTGQHLIAAQTVLVEDYWREIATGLADLGHEVFHVVLHADAETLHARIDADTELPERIRPWRHRYVETYQSARSWLAPAADLSIDTASSDATSVARQLSAAVAARL